MAGGTKRKRNGRDTADKERVIRNLLVPVISASHFSCLGDRARYRANGTVPLKWPTRADTDRSIDDFAIAKENASTVHFNRALHDSFNR